MIELLGVIALMGILIAVAVPSVLTISERMKTKMYCEKMEFIENGAQLWGQDNYNLIFNTDTDSIEVTVSDLVKKNYLNKDEVDEEGKGYVSNPLDGASLMDRKVNVFIKNTRVYAEYILLEEEKDYCD